MISKTMWVVPEDMESLALQYTRRNDKAVKDLIHDVDPAPRVTFQDHKKVLVFKDHRDRLRTLEKGNWLLAVKEKGKVMTLAVIEDKAFKQAYRRVRLEPICFQV